MNSKIYKTETVPAGKGLTIMEMVIALAIIALIFATMLPQFRNIENSWDTRRAGAEILQNSRVLASYLNRHLSKAVRIVAVSTPWENNGFIEYQGSDGFIYRTDIGLDGYVRFGPKDSPVDLAGPVSALRFTSFALEDMDHPTNDVSLIRFVKIEGTMINASANGSDRMFTTSAMLTTNYQQEAPLSMEGMAFQFDGLSGKNPDVVNIAGSFYLCAYEGNASDGMAAVLYIDTDTWTISKPRWFEFDVDEGSSPSLVKIDEGHYLCAYTGLSNVGKAVVLTIDPMSKAIGKGPTMVFEPDYGDTPSLAKIDEAHYLCVYDGPDTDGWAVVLTVNKATWTVTAEIPFEFDINKGQTPDIAQIDNRHYLCVYHGLGNDGWAVILEVNTATWGISRGVLHEFTNLSSTYFPAVSRVDNNNFLCVYMNSQGGQKGWAIILTVDVSTLTVGSGLAYKSDSGGTTPAVIAVDPGKFLTSYSPTGTGFDGVAVVLNVNPSTDAISENNTFVYDATRGMSPDFVRIDQRRFLCVYEGKNSSGWAVILDIGYELKP